MAIQLLPEPEPDVAAAVAAAVRGARIALEPVHAGYASAWRRAGLAEGVLRIGAGAEVLPYRAAPSRRRARGAIRA